MQIRAVRAELFHAGRHDEANGRLSQFRERPYKRIMPAILQTQLLFLCVREKCREI